MGEYKNESWVGNNINSRFFLVIKRTSVRVFRDWSNSYEELYFGEKKVKMWVKYRNKNWVEFESQIWESNLEVEFGSWIWESNLRVEIGKMRQNALFPTIS